jgi:YVTN family beta-propeller protein
MARKGAWLAPHAVVPGVYRRAMARSRKRQREIGRRRAVALAVLLGIVALIAGVVVHSGAGAGAKAKTAPRVVHPADPARTRAKLLVVHARPSDLARLELRTVITGPISPKSVASSEAGYVTAQNMMYRHTMTVYDASSLKLVKTISDAVRLSRLGYPEYPGIDHGAPVEAAFAPDGRYAYVSNYSMYGSGFGPEASDSCTPSSGYDRSFLYRVDMKKLAIDRAYHVGEVPKVVSVTPDGRYVLATNWCSWDLSVVSTWSNREVRRIPIGPYPRGIAIEPDGSAAYVAIMGGNQLVRVDLRHWTTRLVWVGQGPRALALSPNGRYIYVSLNAEGRVAKLDTWTGVVRAKVSTGSAPRSLTIAPDGKAIYVVNYESGTVTKLRTSDMSTLQTIDACFHPIGITYDRATRRVWVACYTGSIRVYNDW